MKDRKGKIAMIPALICLPVAVLVAGGVSYFSDFGFWPAFAIVLVAALINGIVAEAEDNAPGGFNHPQPDDSELPPKDTRPSGDLRRDG